MRNPKLKGPNSNHPLVSPPASLPSSGLRGMISSPTCRGASAEGRSRGCLGDAPHVRCRNTLTVVSNISLVLDRPRARWASPAGLLRALTRFPADAPTFAHDVACPGLGKRVIERGRAETAGKASQALWPMVPTSSYEPSLCHPGGPSFFSWGVLCVSAVCPQTS